MFLRGCKWFVADLVDFEDLQLIVAVECLVFEFDELLLFACGGVVVELVGAKRINSDEF